MSMNSKRGGRRVLSRRLRNVLTVGAVLAALAVLVPVAAWSTGSIRHFPTFNGTDIIDGTLSGRDIKNKSLTPSDFRGSIRGARGVPGSAGPQGPQGPQGPGGPAGAAGQNAFGQLDYNLSAPVSIPSLMVVTATVNCDSGLRAVGGGASVADPGSQFLVQSHPDGSTGWTSSVANSDSVAHSTTLYAVCVPAAQVTKTTANAVSLTQLHLSR